MPLMQDPPARIKVRTTATGSLTTFAVDETVISAGYRSFTQAVADGDLASGTDIFPVIVIDTTVTNGPKLFQISTATWNNTTKQLTIVTNYQPASPPSWGTGTRDVLVIDLPALFLLLTGGTLTGILNILLSGAIISPAAETGLVVQRSATAATEVGLSLISGTSGKSRLNMGDTADEDAGGWVYDQATNMMICRTNGADRARIDSSGVLTHSDGRKYVLLAGGGVNATVWYQVAAPTDWTRITSVTENLVTIVGAGSPGTSNNGTGAGGSAWVPAVTVENATLTPSEVGLASGLYGESMGTFTVIIEGSGSGLHSHDAFANSAYRPPRAFVLLASFN